jgi:ASC-1-like (ASCH) protein
MSSDPAVSPPTFQVQKVYFDMIKNRTKTIEGRKNSPTWRGIMINDIVPVRCNNEEVLVKVTDIKLYASLYHYLLYEDINAIMPHTNLVDINNAYLSFWTREEIEENGIRAFHIKLL